MASFLNRCYTSAAQMLALDNNMAFLAGSLDRFQRTELMAPEIMEVQTAVATLLSMSH